MNREMPALLQAKLLRYLQTRHQKMAVARSLSMWGVWPYDRIPGGVRGAVCADLLYAEVFAFTCRIKDVKDDLPHLAQHW